VKEFDTLRASFLLVALVIATLMVVVLVAFTSCSVLLLSGATTPVCSNELREFIKELITMSFSAAIAFAAGRASAPRPPEPKLPDKDVEK
jgi:hypothetical protein